MSSLLDYILPLLSNVGVFIILALGLNLINGVCGQFSLGHAGFWAVGAYTAGSYGLYFAPDYFPPFINLFISCLLGMTVSALFGFLIGVPCLRLRGDYLAIATLGFGEIIRIIIMNTDQIGGPRGMTNIPHWTNIYWIFLWVIICTLVVINIVKGPAGRAMASIREDEIASESMGVNTFKFKTMAFVVGAAMAGIAGALFAHDQQFLHPNNFTFMWSVIILLMIILGGLGSITGAILGAVVLTILPEILRFMGPTIAEWRMVIYSLLLIALMLWRPKGILGKKEINIFFFLNKNKQKGDL